MNNVVTQGCYREISYCQLVEVEANGKVSGWTYIDPMRIKPEQKTIHSVQLRSYQTTGGFIDILEDHDLYTWEEAQAKIQELQTTYPDAELDEY
jgi:hypothetical protein